MNDQRAVRAGARVVAGVLVTGAAFVGVSWGLYDLGWAIKSNSVNRAAAINRESVGFQQARVDEITRKLSDVATLRAEGGDQGQILAIQNIICVDWRQVTPSYRDGLDLAMVNQLQTMCDPSFTSRP